MGPIQLSIKKKKKNLKQKLRLMNKSPLIATLLPSLLCDVIAANAFLLLPRYTPNTSLLPSSLPPLLLPTATLPLFLLFIHPSFLFFFLFLSEMPICTGVPCGTLILTGILVRPNHGSNKMVTKAFKN